MTTPLLRALFSRQAEPVTVTADPTRRLLAELDRPADAFAHVTPNWFAAVMGTGIVANAAVTLPVVIPGLRVAATAVWILATVLLMTLLIAFAVHWTRHRGAARRYAGDPVMGHFYGALPMAMLTVGAGTLTLGADLIGLDAALAVDWTLWIAGTAIGLYTAFTVPLRLRGSSAASSAFGGWLMPVVPPMVSATTGAALVTHLPAGTGRTLMLLTCYVCFVVTLIWSVVLIPVIARQVLTAGAGAARTVPTVFIVLGPLGQSATAAIALGMAAGSVFTAGVASTLLAAGIGYAAVALLLATAWTAVATRLVARQARAGLPFALTWWSFTFPIGTCATGLAALSRHLAGPPLAVAAVAVYAVLVLAWATVFSRTVVGAARGRLLLSMVDQIRLDAALTPAGNPGRTRLRRRSREARP